MNYKGGKKRGHGLSFRSHQREHDEPQSYLVECQEEAFQLKGGDNNRRCWRKGMKTSKLRYRGPSCSWD